MNLQIFFSHYTTHLFINNLESNLHSVMVNDPFLTVALGDFNAKSSL